MSADLTQDRSRPQEGYVAVHRGTLYYRQVGSGQPIVVLHGGPDFSHTYLLPKLDRLSDPYRLLYYDQRGRGRSVADVSAEDVSIESEIADLEDLRRFFGLQTIALLGHSWGGVLAMEYALRHADCVSHLILMNTAPASHDDYKLFRQQRLKTAPADVQRLQEISATDRYQEGNPDADAEYYRVHFRATLPQPERLEQVVKSLRLDFDRGGILKAREIESRLMDDTWRLSEYNLLPRLARLDIPTLVLYGDRDLVPLECAAHISEAIPRSRLAVLEDTGHFSFLDSPDAVRREIDRFFREA